MVSNGKATIQKLYEEIMPIIKDIATHTTEITNIKKDIKEIKDSKDALSSRIDGKISIKAFATWLSITTVTITTVLLIASHLFHF